MTTLSQERTLADFAEEAGRHFAAHPEHWTYSREELGPGVLLALRWGLGKDCVLVVKTDAEFFPVNFQQAIQEARP